MTSTRISSDRPRSSQDSQNYGAGRQPQPVKVGATSAQGKAIEAQLMDRPINTALENATAMLKTAQKRAVDKTKYQDNPDSLLLETDIKNMAESIQDVLTGTSKGFNQFAVAIPHLEYVWPDNTTRKALHTTLNGASNVVPPERDSSFNIDELARGIQTQKSALNILAQKVKDACEDQNMKKSLKRCTHESPETGSITVLDVAKDAIATIEKAQKFAAPTGLISTSNCSREKVKELTPQALIKHLQNLNQALKTGQSTSASWGSGSR